MLPTYIVDEIIKREKRITRVDEIGIECPVPSGYDDGLDQDSSEEENRSDRGVVILDFTI